MIGILHYGMGNVTSVLNALDYLKIDAKILRGPDEMKDCDQYILPGVGAFGQGMASLKQMGFQEALEKYVRVEKRPLMGICLGMQLMATLGTEFGEHEGLNLIPGTVKLLEARGLRLPHIGWNALKIVRENPFIHEAPEKPLYHYYVHSYHFVPEDPQATIFECDYGQPFTAAIQQENLVAFQFHPEKSQQAGLEILKRYSEWRIPC